MFASNAWKSKKGLLLIAMKYFGLMLLTRLVACFSNRLEQSVISNINNFSYFVTHSDNSCRVKNKELEQKYRRLNENGYQFVNPRRNVIMRKNLFPFLDTYFVPLVLFRTFCSFSFLLLGILKIIYDTNKSTKLG